MIEKLNKKENKGLFPRLYSKRDTYIASYRIGTRMLTNNFFQSLCKGEKVYFKEQKLTIPIFSKIRTSYFIGENKDFISIIRTSFQRSGLIRILWSRQTHWNRISSKMKNKFEHCQFECVLSIKHNITTDKMNLHTWVGYMHANVIKMISGFHVPET